MIPIYPIHKHSDCLLLCQHKQHHNGNKELCYQTGICVKMDDSKPNHFQKLSKKAKSK